MISEEQHIINRPCFSDFSAICEKQDLKRNTAHRGRLRREISQVGTNQTIRHEMDLKDLNKIG